MLTDWLKQAADLPIRCALSNDNCLSQLVVDVVASVFDGNGTAASAAGNNGDGLAAVAAQGEQETVQLRVAGVDAGNDVFFSEFSCGQIHRIIASLLDN